MTGGTKHALKSKTMWGGVLMLAALILAQFGVEVSAQEQATIIDLGLSIADGVVGLIGLVLVIYGRWTAKKGLGVGFGVSGLGGGKLPVIALALLLPVAAISGCAMTPLARVTEARRVYTDTLDVLTMYRRAGLISDAQALEIEALRREAAAALDAAEAAAIEGGREEASSQLEIFERVLDALIAIQSSKAAEQQSNKSNIERRTSNIEHRRRASHGNDRPGTGGAGGPGGDRRGDANHRTSEHGGTRSHAQGDRRGQGEAARGGRQVAGAVARELRAAA